MISEQQAGIGSNVQITLLSLYENVPENGKITLLGGHTAVLQGDTLQLLKQVGSDPVDLRTPLKSNLVDCSMREWVLDHREGGLPALEENLYVYFDKAGANLVVHPVTNQFEYLFYDDGVLTYRDENGQDHLVVVLEKNGNRYLGMSGAENRIVYTDSAGETCGIQDSGGFLWWFGSSATLTVSGSGALSSRNPWGNSPTSQTFTRIEIENGITGLTGAQLFTELTNVTALVIPHSVAQIDSGVFGPLSNLEQIYYAGSQAEFEQIYQEDLTRYTIHYNYTGD